MTQECKRFQICNCIALDYYFDGNMLTLLTDFEKIITN